MPSPEAEKRSRQDISTGKGQLKESQEVHERGKGESTNSGDFKPFLMYGRSLHSLHWCGRTAQGDRDKKTSHDNKMWSSLREMNPQDPETPNLDRGDEAVCLGWVRSKLNAEGQGCEWWEELQGRGRCPRQWWQHGQRLRRLKQNFQKDGAHWFRTYCCFCSKEGVLTGQGQSGKLGWSGDYFQSQSVNTAHFLGISHFPACLEKIQVNVCYQTRDNILPLLQLPGKWCCSCCMTAHRNSTAAQLCTGDWVWCPVWNKLDTQGLGASTYTLPFTFHKGSESLHNFLKISLVEIRKLRLREVLELSHRHTAKASDVKFAFPPYSSLPKTAGVRVMLCLHQTFDLFKSPLIFWPDFIYYNSMRR